MIQGAGDNEDRAITSLVFRSNKKTFYYNPVRVSEPRVAVNGIRDCLSLILYRTDSAAHVYTSRKLDIVHIALSQYDFLVIVSGRTLTLVGGVHYDADPVTNTVPTVSQKLA